MEKVTEIIKTETSTEFNHIRVLLQEYLIENGKKQKIGNQQSYVIICGDIDSLRGDKLFGGGSKNALQLPYSLEKKFPPSEWWPKELVEDFKLTVDEPKKRTTPKDT